VLHQPHDSISSNALENWSNAFELHGYYNGMNAIELELDAYPEIQKRYFF